MTTRRARWLVPTGLIALSAVPVLAGSLRLAELSGSPEVTADNARFVAAPLPVVLHIIGATVYCIVGAFQFVPGLRRGAWHRRAGRVLVPCGLVAALSGLWMTVFYDLPPGNSTLSSALRFIFGSAMAASIVLGFVAVRRRDFERHRAWMIRGYAIGQGAGTQAVIGLPWLLLFGMEGDLAFAVMLGSGWVINLVIAELVIGRARVAVGAQPAL